MAKPHPRLLFLVNVDWFFLSHRLPIALAAKKAGMEVYVAAADTGHGKTITASGLHFINIPFSRKGTGLFRELLLLPVILRLFLRLRPALVHNVTIKPVIYGSLVARLFSKTAVVNAITGMGFVFSADKKAGRLLRMVKIAYRLALGKKRMRVIFQNESDRSIFLQHKLTSPEKTVLIRGSGVDCELFKPSEAIVDNEKPIVLLASRMIRDKGVETFVEAAQIVKQECPQVRFVLAGMVDEGNPNAISAGCIRGWEEQGLVEWWGHRTDMAGVISRAAVVSLPSYYPEGVPKILIEAAASGKAIVTTNRPGCNDIVKDGVNGILVPEKDPKALAGALIKLLNNPDLRRRYGQEGRNIAVSGFSEDAVVKKTMALYKEVMGSRRPS